MNNPSVEKAKAAQKLSAMTTSLCNNVSSYAGSNFDLTPNPAWQQLRKQLNDFDDFVSSYGYLFDEAVSVAATNLHDFCREVLAGISTGNSDRNHYNNHISVEGTDIRNGFWIKFTERSPELRRRLTEALRADMNQHQTQEVDTPQFQGAPDVDQTSKNGPTKEDSKVNVIISSSPGHNRGRIIVDGQNIPFEEVTAYSSPPSIPFICILRWAALTYLGDKEPSDFSPPIGAIEFYDTGLRYSGFDVSASLFLLQRRQITFAFTFHADLWKYAWSIARFKEQFIETLVGKAARASLLEEESVLTGRLTFDVVLEETNLQIGQVLSAAKGIVEALISETETALKAEVQDDTLIVLFDFPNEIAVVCEQYLVYFVQFLQDLGVKAEADLRHEAGQVLFSVKPDAKDTALENIREALNIYLQLPANPNIGMMMPVGDIQMQQLVATIQFTQGNLRLAYATIQQQETTLQQRQETIANQASIIHLQQQILSGEIFSQSLRPAPTKQNSDDRAEFFDGVVALTKVEKYGFELSLAKIVKKLRAKFSTHQTQTPAILLIPPPGVEKE